MLVSCSFLSNERSVLLQNNQGQSIYVKVYNENGNKLAFVLHGLASDMNHQVVQSAKKAFLDNGYTVVTFDARYSLGKSYGNVSDVSLNTFLEDLETIINWAKKQPFYREPFAVAGHSLGGATTILYSHNNDNSNTHNNNNSNKYQQYCEQIMFEHNLQTFNDFTSFINHLLNKSTKNETFLCRGAISSSRTIITAITTAPCRAE